MDLHSLNDIEIIKRIDDLKAEVDALRPFNEEQEGRIMQKFRLDWNYHSNAIEGNTLDYGETVAFLMHGITAKGKPFKDYLDLKGHDEAISFLLDFVRAKEELTEKDIRSLHSIILVEPYQTDAVTQTGLSALKTINIGTYKKSPNHVKTATGQIHYYATPEDTPILMGELMKWYKEEKEKKTLHPVVFAAIFHHRFAAIHPFDDGNGRMARLLMNLILMQLDFPPVVIKQDKSDRNEYYLALSIADTGDLLSFVEFIAQRQVDSFELYLKGAHGEDLDEPDDLDKEIALFKKNLEGRADKIEQKKSKEVLQTIYETSLKPLHLELSNFFKKLTDMFLTFEIKGLSYDKDNKYIYVDFKYSDTIAGEPYTTFLNKEPIVHEDWADFSINYYSSLTHIFLAYRLNEFKIANNPFGIELKVLFSFDDYKYSIAYSISRYNELEGVSPYGLYLNLNTTAINKTYHQLITREEIKNSVNKIGKEVLGFIKIYYENSERFKVELTTEEIKKYWEEYLFILTDKEEVHQLDKCSPIIEKGSKIVFAVKDSSLVNDVERKSIEFVKFLAKKHYIDHSYYISVYYDDLPF